MHRASLLIAVAIGAAFPALASAAKFSWLDDSPGRDSLGQLRPPSSFFDRDKRLTFGVDAYKSLTTPDDDGERVANVPDAHLVSFYGEVLGRPNDFYAPLAALDRHESASLFESSGNRLSGFGVKWQHRVDASNTLALSAGYSESPWTKSTTPGVDMSDTRAAVSWTSTWADTTMRPGMTGSVFVGDESAREEGYQRLGRKYMGFALGGQLQVTQDHTPYLSYRMQRSYYNNAIEEPAYTVLPYEDRSQVAAGWRWQVQSNWSVHAEASYGLNGVTLDPYTADRSRVFFGTRFDFR